MDVDQAADGGLEEEGKKSTYQSSITQLNQRKFHSNIYAWSFKEIE